MTTIQEYPEPPIPLSFLATNFFQIVNFLISSRQSFSITKPTNNLKAHAYFETGAADKNAEQEQPIFLVRAFQKVLQNLIFCQAASWGADKFAKRGLSSNWTL